MTDSVMESPRSIRYLGVVLMLGGRGPMAIVAFRFAATPPCRGTLEGRLRAVLGELYGAIDSIEVGPGSGTRPAEVAWVLSQDWIAIDHRPDRAAEGQVVRAAQDGGASELARLLVEPNVEHHRLPDAGRSHLTSTKRGRCPGQAVRAPSLVERTPAG